MSSLYQTVKSNTNKLLDDYNFRLVDKFNTTIPILNQYLDHNSKVHNKTYMEVKVDGLWGQWLTSLNAEDINDLMMMYQTYYTKEGFKFSYNKELLTFTIYWE
ncbi:Hypothetical protein ORPV_57 [Orpheovirus IHUMI-LCC2]|uniref:Uncharacterized protein n=1 Tax=Orpheovirus IHUMI-LCC2 TaxID=2023057 RepID=A0A2I2L358_9VIRU|nr:Hypothetical protein ORPV_57 [Orpheovirus IHUMI-LCC2]SNW61961.1 Hypothetical protein ORPV_57 [Orpheovirus IHUMI-LCC2]